MRLVIEMELDNGAFVDAGVVHEVNRILVDFGRKAITSNPSWGLDEQLEQRLVDRNGNVVGQSRLEG